MALPAFLKSTVDPFLDALAASLAPKQETRGGRYAQLLPTTDVVPVSGSATTPKDVTSKPTGAKPTDPTWASLAVLPAKVPCAVEVHEYLTPKQERGWVLIATATDGVTKYRRAIGFGPEARDQAWAAVPVTIGGGK